MDGPAPGLSGDRRQLVQAVAGFAYGAVGADIHVFGDGTPVYLLYAREAGARAGPESEWLRAQPSRMLDARRAVVEFTGRSAAVADLLSWCDAPAGFAVRWLHGAGGSGKSRLAARLATACAEDGWLVVDAVHGTDVHPPAQGSQDLRADGRRGMLLLVDYADRWPDGHLSWLFQNSLLHRGVPTRVLLIARSSHAWPALRAQLNRLGTELDTSDQLLPSLPAGHGGERGQMFAAARRGFARHFPPIAGGAQVPVPAGFAGPEFGLTMAVHMAALVAVDAQATGRAAPDDLTGMTAYLLDREYDSWRQVRAEPTGGAQPATTAAELARAVFTAVLTGPQRRETAEKLLQRLLPRSDAAQVLTDHAACYPGPDQVLQPLLPDRLAEDYLALTMPGSPVTGYPTDRWTVTAATRLLAREEGKAPVYTPRALAYLTAAASRWPHVADRLLYPLLRRDPALAVTGGSAVLSSLAAIESVDQDVLAGVEAVLPAGDVRVDVGGADLTARLATERLDHTSPAAEQAALHTDLCRAAITAGRDAPALTHAEQAVRLYREAADRDPAHRLALAEALVRLGGLVAGGGRPGDGVVLLREAADLLRAIDAGTVAMARLNAVLAVALWQDGRRDEALALVQETLELYDRLMEDDLATYFLEMPQRAELASMRRTMLAESGQVAEAVQDADWNLGFWRQLAGLNPAVYGHRLAGELRRHSELLWRAGRHAEAVEAARESADLYRQLAEVRPADRETLLLALTELVAKLAELGRHDEAAPLVEEALALHRGSAPDELDVAGIAGLLRYGRDRRAAQRVAWGTGTEIDEEAERLARSQRPEALWELIRAVPVVDAIRLARHHPRNRWTPPGKPADALRRTGRALRSAVRAVAQAAEASVWRAPYLLVRASQVGFAPGLPVLAFEQIDGPPPTVRIDVVDLETRSRLWTAYEGPVEHNAISCHGPESVLALRTPAGSRSDQTQLVHYGPAAGDEQVLASGTALLDARLAATRDGYVVSSRLAPVALLLGVNAPGRQVDLAGLGLGYCTGLAVDPTGTRLALTDGHLLVVTDAQLTEEIASVLLPEEDGVVRDLSFASPDEIVTAAVGGGVVLYQLAAGRLFTAESSPGLPVYDLFAVPAWGIVGGWLPSTGGPCFFDAVTLRPVAAPASVIGGGAGLQAITASPDGRFVAYGGWLHMHESPRRRSAAWTTAVHDLRPPPSWLPYPIAALSREDLAHLTAFLDSGPPVPRPTRELLDLVRALAGPRPEDR